MKSVIISAILIAIVIWGSAAYTGTLEKVSSELIEINSQISSKLSNDDFNGAMQDIERLEEYIDSKNTFLSAMNNHAELDNIEMNLAELKRYTEGGAHTDAMSKSSVLDFLFAHLPKNYKLRLENIL